MRSRIAIGALLLAGVPAVAEAGYGGGGVMVGEAPLGTLGRADLAAGTLGCIGGVGYGVGDGRRMGGQGTFCGNGRSAMAFGGVEVGRQFDVIGLYGAVYSGFGAGWMHAGDPAAHYDAVYAYARPTAAVGIPVGIGAVEVGAYVMLPWDLVQVIGGDLPPLATFPHAGLQATLLFGDFAHRRRWEPEPIAMTDEAPVSFEDAIEARADAIEARAEAIEEAAERFEEAAERFEDEVHAAVAAPPREPEPIEDEPVTEEHTEAPEREYETSDLPLAIPAPR